MRLIILGSGTPVPMLERSCAAYLLEFNGKRALFDSGAGTIRRLLELKIDLFSIDYIFYTHLHNDHINDLGAVIWSNNYGGIRKRELNLYGPKGFKKYFEVLVKKLLKPAKLYFNINLNELKNSITKIDGVIIKTKEIRHSSTTKSIAYRAERKGKSFVYAGDTEYCDELIEIARDADVLLVECSFPDDKKVEGHLTPSLAGEIAAKANVKHVVLTHFYPEVLRTDIKKACSKKFCGKITIAKDKIKINI